MGPGAAWGALLAAGLAAGAAEDGDYWPRQGRDVKSSGSSPHVGPRSFAEGPAWSWGNEEDELVRHGPLIDGAKNLYLVTSYGRVRKLSPDGALLWAWAFEPPHWAPSAGKIVAAGALYNGSIYLTTGALPAGGGGGSLVALSMETGKPHLMTPLPRAVGTPSSDSHGIALHDGTVFLPSRDGGLPELVPGNNKVVALRASDGELLWERLLATESRDTQVLNFMPAFPGDGTLLFSTPTARAYRLNASNGEIIWKARFQEPGGFHGAGGGALSPDGRLFFAAGAFKAAAAPSSPNRTIPPCDLFACLFGDGLIMAYRVDDGEILWARRLLPGTSGQQYPAVGFIDGPGSRMAVFVGAGVPTREPQIALGEQWLPGWLRLLIPRLMLRWGGLRRLFQVPSTSNHLLALDAETGAELWHWEEEPWGLWASAGEEERLPARLERHVANSRHDFSCRPQPWAVPTIGADGTVYAASGNTGNLYAIRDANGDGRIQDGEVSTFKTHNGFRGSPSLAPGLLAASPCWGPMYVFKG